MTCAKTPIVILMVCLLTTFSFAQQKVKIEGVWEMVSQKVDGKETFVSGRQIKVITKKHFSYIFDDKDNALFALAKKTLRDSLDAYVEQYAAGAGTYTLMGNTYTETIEFSRNPSRIGHLIDFTVKVEGDRFYQSGKYPVFEGNKKVREILLEEVYKRLE